MHSTVGSSSNQSLWRSVNRRNPCQICDHPDWCRFTDDGALARCMRKQSMRPTRHGGWLHVLRYDDVPPPRPPVPFQKPEMLVATPQAASAERCNAVYSDLLHRHLVLSSGHHANLRARGLSDRAIETQRYRSVPTSSFAVGIARALSDDHDLAQVPGFYRGGEGWRLNFTEWYQGIIIPVLDTRGRIRALAVRRDQVSKQKYVWLTSKEKPDGVSSCSPPHFAKPEIARLSGEMIFTEGALKANIISSLTGQAVCGIAGVSNFAETFGRDVRRALPELRRAVVAYDADFRTNVAVRDGLTKLRQNLRSAGLVVSVMAWQPELGKGFDDALAIALKGAA